MNNLKLSLLKKWELDSELSFVHGSVLLPDGTAIILTKGEKSDWGKFYLLVLSVDGIKKIPIEYVETYCDWRLHPGPPRRGHGLRHGVGAWREGDFERAQPSQRSLSGAPGRPHSVGRRGLPRRREEPVHVPPLRWRPPAPAHLHDDGPGGGGPGRALRQGGRQAP